MSINEEQLLIKLDSNAYVEVPDSDLVVQEVLDQAVTDIHDVALQSILTHNLYTLDANERPSISDVKETAMTFLGLTFWSLSARGALIWLGTNSWDLEKTLTSYMNERFRLYGEPGTGKAIFLSEIPQSGQATRLNSPEPPLPDAIGYIDEDPVNIGNIPLEIEVIKYKPLKRARSVGISKSVPAVFHEDIRKYLIALGDAKGKYRYGREAGAQQYDITSYIGYQRNWGLDRKRHFPAIVFQPTRDEHDNPKYPNDKIPPMKWRGLLVLDSEGIPIKRFHYIPATLSTQLEGGYIEAMTREDSRCGYRDMIARMPREMRRGVKRKIETNSISQRTMRFRVLNDLKAWNKRKPMNPNKTPTQRLLGAQISTSRPSPETSSDEVLSLERPQGDVSGEELDETEYEDSRDLTPISIQEQIALYDALLITFVDFLEFTGSCPRLPRTDLSYNSLMKMIQNQFQDILGRTASGPDRVQLRVIDHWSGGILNWRSGRVVAANTLVVSEGSEEGREMDF